MNEVLCPVCQRDTVLGFQGNDLKRCHTCDNIFQYPPTVTAKYGAEYVDARYEKYPTTEIMSYLRLGILKSIRQRGTVLDYGYGNGSFVKACLKGGYTAFGYDCHTEHKYGIPVIESLDAAKSWNVVTFFDSIEHVADLEPIRQLAKRTEAIIVSVPNRPRDFPQNPNWRHNRHGEHVWFPVKSSLERLFQMKTVLASDAEDSIRGQLDGHQNIMTYVFERE